jgi:hypothetical protein
MLIDDSGIAQDFNFNRAAQPERRQKASADSLKGEVADIMGE